MTLGSAGESKKGAENAERERAIDRETQRHANLRVAAVLALLTPALLGTQCNPTPPSCDTTACPAGEVRVCLDRCVTPAAEGEPCSDDPCDTTAQVCAFGLSCAGGFGTGGRHCVALDPPFETLFCRTDVQLFQPCQTGLTCRGYEDAANAACVGFQRPGFLPPEFDGQCVLPRREGSTCDASWGEPGCAVCEPGTECLADPRDPGKRTCFRPCADASRCACPSEDPAVLDTCQTMVLEPSSQQGICTGCATIGQECSAEASSWGCCDRRNGCVGGVCCRDVGSPCGRTEECCGEGQCIASGIASACHVCGPAGAPPDLFLGCCPGLEVRNGVCSVPCVEGARCSPLGCPRQMGTTTCTTTGPICVAERLPEECNGMDDDCDGVIDDGIAPRACSADPGGCGRLFDGTQACTGGAWGAGRVGDCCRYQSGGGELDPDAPLGFSHGASVNLDDSHSGMRLCDSSMPGGGGNAACSPGTVCITNCDRVAVCQPHDQTLSCGAFEPDLWTALPCEGVLCWTAADLASTSPPGGASMCQ